MVTTDAGGKTDTTGKEETKEDDGGSAEAHGRIRGIFVLLGIMISQAFMLAGFLLVALYFVFDVLSRKEYEYILDGKTLTIDVIYGKRYRKTAHIIDMTEMEVTAPNRHEAVAKYRKDGGGVRLPKFDYTSYEDDIPYYTMIVIEDREKKNCCLISIRNCCLHSKNSILLRFCIKW